MAKKVWIGVATGAVALTVIDSNRRVRIITKRLEAPKTGAFNFSCQQNVNKTLKFGYFLVLEKTLKIPRVLCLDDIIILSEGVIP